MWVPELLVDINGLELSQLYQAELAIEAEFPKTVYFTETENRGGEKGWLLKDNAIGVVVRQDPRPPTVSTKAISIDPLRLFEGKLMMNVIALTRVGAALAAIVPHDEESVFHRLAKAISGNTEGSAMFVRSNSEGGMSSVEDAGDDVSPEQA